MRLDLRGAGHLGVASALLILGIALARCQSAPRSALLQEPQLEFVIVDSARAVAEAQPALSMTAPGTLELSGVISTPNPCYDIDAGLSADGQTLTLTLTASARPGICVQVLGAFPYRATISRLSPGAYQLVVRHVYPGTGWEERLYRLRADVP